MRAFRLVLTAAVAAAGLATSAPAGAARCVPVDRPPINRICVVTTCDYDPETGYIRCW
jgi:hypothetical protein